MIILSRSLPSPDERAIFIPKMSEDYENNEEIQIFREYLRIPSVHPDIDYEPCIVFLRKQAEGLGLKHQTIVIKNPKRMIFVATWTGTEPELPSILLNSHMDVVPVFEEHWTHPPFAAEIEEGRIYARGSQDMKCVGTWYLAAIRALKKSGFKPRRTIHVLYVPEEETGGDGGMKDFVHTEEFRALNVGFAMDEAGASTGDAFHIFFAERVTWGVEFKISGKPGHGLQLFRGTVGEKAAYLMNKLNEFRLSQIEKIKGFPSHMPTVTAINLTMLEGGVQANVIPPQISLTYDMRLAIDVDHAKFEEMLRQWCAEAGGGIEMNFLSKEPAVAPTKMDASNQYWLAFKAAVDELGHEVVPIICPGATDVRYVRALGIPAIGFMPVNNTPVLLHDHDEFLRADTYLHGIKVYQRVLEKLSTL